MRNTRSRANSSEGSEIIISRIHKNGNFHSTRYLLPSYKGATMKIQLITKAVGALLAAAWVGTASAAPLAPSLPENSMFAAVAVGTIPEQIEPDATVKAHLRRQVVNYRTEVGAGTIVIDTAQTLLYYVLGDGTAIRYGIGVGRDGFAWAGTEVVTRKAENRRFLNAAQ